MKPTFQSHPARHLASRRAFCSSINKIPVTDWNFQSTMPELRGHGSSFHPRATNRGAAFRELSQSFLEAESKRTYRAEAGAFILIVGLAVWPIAQAVHAAMTLLK
ncbi:MAG: hypothetical protein H0X73_07035 [Chthoniobacterales bacterium]|nr:hypothetical protein [Chthoniobacterales bacterium]